MEHFVHHLKAALIVGSAVTLLHAAGLLGSLDGFMLRLIGSAGPEWHVRSTPTQALPVVLLVGSQLYEREFQQASPLKPEVLAHLLQTIPLDGIHRPAAVVLDLDISPAPYDEPGRKLLNATVLQLVGAGVNVVLPLPIRVSTPELQNLKFSWMQELCDANRSKKVGHGLLSFGHTDILTHQGAVSQFDVGAPTIGVVAAGLGPKPSLCEQALANPDRWRPALVGTQFRSSELALNAATHALSPFNSHFFSVETNIRVIRSTNEPLFSPADYPAGSTIFIGGGFNPQDRFLMPLEGSSRPVEGVIVHAATFYSLIHPIGVPSALAAFVLDIALGIMIGYLFAFSWHWHERIASQRVPDDTFGARWKPRASLLANLLLLACMAVICLFIADLFFYPLNVWVNPVPIVIGIFAKFSLASRSKHGDHPPVPESVRRSSRRSVLWADRLDTILLVVLVGIAITVAVQGHE